MPAELWLWQLGDTLGLEAKQAASWKQAAAPIYTSVYITILFHRSQLPPSECQPRDRS